jgi:energy-converting hydrogenase Eha subunit G
MNSNPNSTTANANIDQVPSIDQDDNVHSTIVFIGTVMIGIVLLGALVGAFAHACKSFYLYRRRNRSLLNVDTFAREIETWKGFNANTELHLMVQNTKN